MRTDARRRRPCPLTTRIGSWFMRRPQRFDPAPDPADRAWELAEQLDGALVDLGATLRVEVGVMVCEPLAAPGDGLPALGLCVAEVSAQRGPPPTARLVSGVGSPPGRAAVVLLG